MILSLTISLLGLLFLLINSILFFVTRKNKDVSYRTITYYFILLFIIESCCTYMGAMYPNSNFFISHYYFIFQFVFLSVFFYKLFSNAYIKLLISGLLFAEVVALGIQYYNFPYVYYQFNVFEIASTSIILVLYASIFLITNFYKIQHDYYNFCAGLIIYLSSSCLIFLSGNTDLVLFTEPFFFDIWIFNSLFYLIYQFLIYKEWLHLNRKKENAIVEKSI